MFITDANLFWVLLISSELDLRAQNPSRYREPLPSLLQHGGKYRSLSTFPKSLSQ